MEKNLQIRIFAGGVRSRLAGTARCLCLAMLALALNAHVAQGQLRIQVTEGQVAATHVAITDFIGPDGKPSDRGRQIANIVSNDLESSGLFRPVEAAAIIQPEESLTARQDFEQWGLLGATGLLVGSVSSDDQGKLRVEFILWDVVTERALTRGEGSADPDALRQLSHKIADIVYEEFTGDSGYFDSQIVYIAESGSQSSRIKRLAIMDQDGHNHQYLTSGVDLVLTPRFSPTTQEIAYLNYFNDEPNVFIQDVRTGRSERLGSFPGMTFAPRFGPNGDKIIMSWAQDGLTDIYEMNLQTQEINQLTKSTSIDTAPSYSPDGKRVVFESDRAGRQQLYVMNSDGSGAKRISYGDGRYATPVWSPRGDLIAFTKLRRDTFYIGVMNADGTGERLIADGFLVEAPTWSPNGRVIMYYKQEPFRADGSGGSTSLYRVDITGFNEKRVITPTDASDPAWSPLRRD